jgi:glycosyltransferase involved in cell wall biosynthesis
VRILRVHNRYQQRGGEDAVFEAEVALLRERNEIVQELEVANQAIAPSRLPLASAKLALATVWSPTGHRLVADAIDAFRPDVVHFDNTFPLVSPAAYTAARKRGTPVIQTLHNYRLLCPSATLYRNGAVCEDCIGHLVPLPGVIHGCYRDSRAQSTVVAAMLATHRLRRTWSRDVDRYIALSDFARSIFVEGGLPPHLISVKPNFVVPVADPRLEDHGDVLFVGRLAPEKGVTTLLAAASLLEDSVIRIAGDGPLAGELATAVQQGAQVLPLGRLTPDLVKREMLSARALVFPSEWYEGFPLTILEAFAAGLPVIASHLGAMTEIVEDGRTGLLFEPGNLTDLAAKIRWAHANPEQMRAMGENARREYEANYSPDRNYGLLIEIYEQAIHHAQYRKVLRQ